jgi:hypothetical protein
VPRQHMILGSKSRPSVSWRSPKTFVNITAGRRRTWRGSRRPSFSDTRSAPPGLQADKTYPIPSPQTGIRARRAFEPPHRQTRPPART